MITLHIRVQAQDPAEWKKMLKTQLAVRKKFGCKGGQVYHNEDDPCDIFMILKWDTRENAESFMEDPDVQASMFETLADMPDITYIDEEYPLEA